VSFGLPAREIINATFYQMTKDEGVTALIINPKLKPKADDTAKNALLGLDEQCSKYVEKYAGFKTEEIPSVDMSISDCIVKGLKGDCLAKLNEVISKENYLWLIDNQVIKGLNVLGDRYEQGKAFLPQLIAGAECAKAALNVIKTYMPENSVAKATMLIATVKGDVHDIGKNIVKTVLANYGFKIIDLGKDVSTEEVMTAIEKYKPQIIGLSALMTTTLDNMAETAKAVKAKYKDIIVMVGGAVVTKSFASSIDALYTKDAQEAVKVLNEIFRG
jgi:5-methyltetrahydrofolate--homocysteine methyltransferase